jgi:hypothetical protein
LLLPYYVFKDRVWMDYMHELGLDGCWNPSCGSKVYIRIAVKYVKMLVPASPLDKDSPRNPALTLLDELKNTVLRVKRARKWFLVDPLTKAFIKACMIMRMSRIKSMTLMKVIIKTIKILRQIISKEYELFQIGIQEAWKLSELASSWGHKTAREWRNNKSYIITQALTLRWLARLFGGIIRVM